MLSRCLFVVLLVVIGLMLAGGLCLFDADSDTGEGLCASFLGLTGGLLLVFSLGLAGRAVPVLTPAYHLYPTDLPSPPPRA